MTDYSEKTVDFFEQVYQVCELIPEGRVTSYGAIAKYLGMARSSRMVGWAMNGSHRRKGVPAHRVVNRIGMLTGKVHFGSPTAMQQLLEREGIKVENDQVVDYKNLYWDPTDELAL